MKSEQFINIIKLFHKHDLCFDYNQLTLLSCIREDSMEIILSKYKECSSNNKKYFMQILSNCDYITYHGYIEILSMIATIDVEDIKGLKYILNKEDVVTMPTLMDYIRIYYKLSTKPYIAYSNEGIAEMIKFVPEVEFESNATILKEALLEKFDYEYAHYVTDIDTFFLEDFDGVLESKIVKYYRFKNKNKKNKADNLIRKLTKEGFIEPDRKIISFKRED